MIAAKARDDGGRTAGVLAAQTVAVRPKPKPKVAAKPKAKAAAPALVAGDRAAEHAVRVLAVVGPRIFWVGRDREHRTLVHVQGAGTRRLVLPGQRVTFVATVARNNARAAASWGLTRREGRDQFRRQDVHFEVYGPRMRFVSF